MQPTTECQPIREELDAYVLGALATEEAGTVEAHIAGCPDCWTELSQSQGIAALLPLAVPLRRPRPELRSRILRAAELSAPAKRDTRRGLVFPSSTRLAAAAAALILGLAAGSLAWSAFLQLEVRQLRSENAESAAHVEQQQKATLLLASADLRTVDMTATAAAPGATGRYIWSGGQGLGLFLSSKLPPPPSGRTYQFWIIRDSKPVSGGTFYPEWEGAVVHVVDWSAGGPATGYGVTIEPEGGSRQPSGGFILWASVPGQEDRSPY